MPQIFHRSFNVVSKASIFGFLFFVAAAAYIGLTLLRSGYVSDTFVAVDQPIPFSHEHHAGDLKIDCRYCHQGVETGAFAGLPPTKTCMNCHSQMWQGAAMLAPVRESYATKVPIQWNRVHKVADFVYFDHSIHVAKGVGCASCHGPVQRMPLTWKVNTLYMEWCLDCHRHPEDHLRPKEEVFNMDYAPPADQRALGLKLIKEYDVKSKTSCSNCHH